jgi:SAM-dependent methyltransferase
MRGGGEMGSLLGKLHGEWVFDRRVRVLTERLASLMPQGASVLDIGTGSGTIARRLQEIRPDVTITGIDPLVRPETAIPVAWFDGQKIPFPDQSVDVALLVDVLHHTEDPSILFGEAVRIARQAIVLKDHTRDGWLAESTLRLMDYVGNAHVGVVLPYQYWSLQEWQKAFSVLGLTVAEWHGSLGLYPPPASWIFDRQLHFIARLERRKPLDGERV